MVRRMATGDWYTTRSSACGLFATIYAKVQPTVRQELRTLYSQLCYDDTPMVRRAASANLGKLAAKGEKDFLKSDLMQMFMKLSHDDQDSVRLLAVENCVAIAKMLTPEENVQHVLPTIRNASQDKSWRVRYMVAKHFTAVRHTRAPSLAHRRRLHLRRSIRDDVIQHWVMIHRDSNPPFQGRYS